MTNNQHAALTNFLVDSIEQDPTPGNVEAVFRTVRALYGTVDGQRAIADVEVAIAQRGSADAMRAVRVGEFDREKTIYIQRPGWKLSIGG